MSSCDHNIHTTQVANIAAMRIADMNWMQLEAYLEQDQRIILPLGCTEQHAYISLATDSILAERVAVEAAEPLGVPVLPVYDTGDDPAELMAEAAAINGCDRILIGSSRRGALYHLIKLFKEVKGSDDVIQGLPTQALLNALYEKGFLRLTA